MSYSIHNCIRKKANYKNSYTGDLSLSIRKKSGKAVKKRMNGDKEV